MLWILADLDFVFVLIERCKNYGFSNIGFYWSFLWILDCIPIDRDWFFWILIGFSQDFWIRF